MQGTKIDLTVILCIYNATNEDLKLTLDSILCQEDVNFEIIIADDASKRNYKKQIDEYMSTKRFTAYTYIRQKRNIGTIDNILSAVLKAKGEIVKPIGTGDFFVDKHVCYDIKKFFNKEKTGIVFGYRPAYLNSDNAFYQVRLRNPIMMKCYNTNKKKEIQRNLIVYGDHISGASIFYKKNILEKYLNLLSGKLKYIEDYIPMFAVLDGIKISLIQRDVVFYQLGTGVSTKKSKENSDRLLQDRLAFEKLIISMYPKEKDIKRLKKITILNNYPKMVRLPIKLILEPGLLIYKLLLFRMNKIGYSIIKEIKV